MGAVLAHTFPDAPRQLTGRRGVSGGKLKLIALGIANRSDDDGRDGWPSYRELATGAQCDLDTVRIGLKALQALGYVLVLQRGDARRANRYALIPAAFETESGTRLSRDQRAAQSRDQRAAEPRSARGSEPRGTSLHPYTSKNARGQSPPEESHGEGMAAVVALARARAALHPAGTATVMNGFAVTAGEYDDD